MDRQQRIEKHIDKVSEDGGYVGALSAVIKGWFPDCVEFRVELTFPDGWEPPEFATWQTGEEE